MSIEEMKKITDKGIEIEIRDLPPDASPEENIRKVFEK